MATEVEFTATVAFHALAESSSKPTLRHSDSTPVLASDSLLTLSFDRCMLQRAGTIAEFEDSSEEEDCEYELEEETIPSPPTVTFTQSSSFGSALPSEVTTPHAPNCSLVGDAAGQHRGSSCVFDDCAHSVQSSTSFTSEHNHSSYSLTSYGVPTKNNCAALPMTPQRATRVAGVRSKSSEPAAQRTQQISPSNCADGSTFSNGANHHSYFYPASSHSFNASCHPAYRAAAQQPSSSIQSCVLPSAYPTQFYPNAHNDHHRQINPSRPPSDITCACFVDHPFLVRPRDVRRGGRGCGRPRSPSPLRVVVSEPVLVETVHNPYSFEPYSVVSHQLHNLNPLPSSMSLTPSIGSVHSPLEYPSDSVSTTISSGSINTAPDSNHSGASSVYPGSEIVISPTDPRDSYRYHRRVPSFSSSPSVDGLSLVGCAQVPVHSVTPMQSYYPCDSHQYYGLPYPAMMGQYLSVPNEFNEMRSRSVESCEFECSDDGRSVVSSVVSTMRTSNVSAVGTEEQVSVVGTEGVKKKRFRARCPTCTTTADVKRLRFKRGFTYFVCTRCHFKWRVPGAR